MATLVLSAVGAAVGGASGISAFGLSGMVIGRAVGATIGRAIDQRLLGSGSEPVEHGQVDRFRFTNASEGAPLARLFGRMRLGGQVIWATQFLERSRTTGGGGGKGAPRQPTTTTYSYSVSLALAICEGEISRVGRIWADGVEIDRRTVNLRIHKGGVDQMPDPLIEAVEGIGAVPAYRGVAYAVFEDLDLSPYGNRVPQFSFEVVRPARPDGQGALVPAPADMLRSVALIPGTGEYALSTTPVHFAGALGAAGAANVSAGGGLTDFEQSLEALRDTLPNLASVSLIYCWFGDDLRAGHCRVRPKVEDRTREGVGQAWRAGGLSRGAAEEIARDANGRPIYGGTPSDAGVIEAIRAIRSGGQEVMFYPLMLMEIPEGNGLPDPWGGVEQAAFPWRGRITSEIAAGQPGSPDGTAANRAAVDAFFGTVKASDFSVSAGHVSYAGPAEWSLSRYVLHSAALCAAAGGVEAFCIGSEFRGLTAMRDDTGFPAVGRLRALAAQVRQLLPDARMSYAADWSEYFGHQPQDGSGEVHFHLDPLWADPLIDFVGIDNYMPLSDWRDGTDHADAAWPSVHDIGYLQSNIEGGEGFDWHYPTDEARAAQRRAPITDGEGGSPWIFRYKALRGWWENAHVDRIHPARRSGLAGGDAPQGWLPRLSPVVTPLAAVHGPYAAPVRVAGGDDPWQRIESPAFACEAGRDYELRLTGGPGSAGGFRASLRAAGAPLVELLSDGTIAPAVATSAGAGAYGLEVLDEGGGVHVVRIVFNLPGPAGVTVDLGPGDCAPGGDVVLFGASLTPWPYPSTAWQPRMKPIVFTEFGCPAIDRGTNQPNKFLDPKSDESAAPHHSTAHRDDAIQAQYLRAVLDYWADPGRNPVSEVYGGPMIDMARAHAWAWDARPWPAFPHDLARWSDGDNWGRGHWLTGRLDAAPLDLVVAEICERAGLSDYDVSGVHGLVRGHVTGETGTARAALQPLMLAHGAQAVEREGRLVFRSMARTPGALLDEGSTALAEDGRGGFETVRAPRAETVGRLRIGYTDGEASYDDRIAEAVHPGDPSDAMTETRLPLALTPPEARALAERGLAEARVARDSIKLSLPPSTRALGAGEVFALGDGTMWRIDRVTERGTRDIEAVRVEPSASEPSDAVYEPAPSAAYLPPLPVEPIFMDLPLLTGDEVAHAPHLAVAATPWPGPVAVWKAPGPDGFTLNRIVERGALAGRLETPLAAAPPGLWDRGAPMRVRIAGGALSSAEAGAVLNGANVAAIGPGDGAGWEVIQFREATLVGEDLWEVSLRLRGQAGTDADMPAVWPEGSLFVVLDGAVGQLDLPASARGLARHWRVGPARRSLDDPSYVERVLAFAGIGLRPLAPVHLRASAEGGDRVVTWIRRSRIDADSWEGAEVPLGETFESYALRVVDAGALRREEVLGAPSFTYTAAMRAADGTSGPYSIEVAQISERFGAGPFARIDIDE
ncbi:glycoside hydrolase TIM-barrel-like domain-containing protein [Roseibacterium sp. SDUM158017]|uniref:baseplate multidomain protein megatron n=1 Tax=Roseicyclus salinarum TaxID=3036773 RepID=UPI0024157843|nr:glycoside hydrolase TIM-barrel-like domain-containing protein [Roseibacterium sp. SDUM158017]MDG4649811.1 glycoside hydrolase TIM-barrel-like domain-containing protein [Roseibacterium sp. SDUM158017]